MRREAELADIYLAEQERRLGKNREPLEPMIPRAPPGPVGLDAEEVERLLIEHDGNISDVAKEIGVGSGRLRAYVMAKPELAKVIDEVFAAAVDESIAVLFKALRDGGSMQNRFYAAKTFLASEEGRRRGFGRDPGVAASIEVREGGRTITLKWIEPDAPGPKLIEGTAE